MIYFQRLFTYQQAGKLLLFLNFLMGVLLIAGSICELVQFQMLQERSNGGNSLRKLHDQSSTRRDQSSTRPSPSQILRLSRSMTLCRHYISRFSPAQGKWGFFLGVYRCHKQTLYCITKSLFSGVKLINRL